MAQRERGNSGARAGSGRGDRRRTPEVTRPEPRSLSGPELAQLRGRLLSIVEPVVRSADLDLEDFAVTRAGRRFVVRVTVDGEAGIGHDELTDASREISAALDAAEASGGEFAADAYTLEVSSPGVDRPLTKPRHWRRNTGRLVKVTVGGKSLTARVEEVADAGVRLEGLAEVVAFDDLGPGRVQIEFNRLAELTDEEIGEEFADTADDDDESADDDVDDVDDDGADVDKEVQT